LGDSLVRKLRWVQDAAWLWPLPSVTSVSLSLVARCWLPLFQRVRLSTPIEFSLPFHSHLHHPSSTISSPSPHVTNDTTLALHCILLQFLPPFHLSAHADSTPDTQFARGHPPLHAFESANHREPPCTSTHLSVQSSAVRYCLVNTPRIPEASLEDKRLVLGVGFRRRL